MIAKKPRRPRRSIMTAEQKKVIIDLLLKIIGDTIKGKLARIAAAGAVAAAATYMEVPVPQPPAPSVPVASVPAVESK